MEVFYSSNKPQILENFKWFKTTCSYWVQKLAYKLHMNEEQNNGNTLQITSVMRNGSSKTRMPTHLPLL